MASVPARSSDVVRELFASEIRSRAATANYAIAGIDRHIRQESFMPEHVEFWALVEVAVGAVAVVGDILWPAQRRRLPAARAKELREQWGLLDDGGVLSSRAVRNSMVHFAERVDNWNARSKSRIFVHSSFFSAGGLNGAAEGDIALGFFIDTFEVGLFGDRLNLLACRLALHKLLKQVPKEMVG